MPACIFYLSPFQQKQFLFPSLLFLFFSGSKLLIPCLHSTLPTTLIHTIVTFSIFFFSFPSLSSPSKEKQKKEKQKTKENTTNAFKRPQ